MGPAERRISRRVFLSSHPEYHQNVARDLIGPDKSAAMCFLSLDNDKPHMSKISQDIHFAVNIWTLPNNYLLLAVYAHFINNQKE